MAVFNATARDMGVTVTDLEHGLVTSGHDAYNVAPTLAAVQRSLPTHPALSVPDLRGVVAGSIQRASRTQGHHRQPPSHRDAPDVGARGAPPEPPGPGRGVRTRPLPAVLRNPGGGCPTVAEGRVQAPPIERARVDHDPGRSFSIDTEPDLYASFALAEAIVAEASTGLFEAVGLVPRIFVWDTAKSRFYLGEHPFAAIAEPEDLSMGSRRPPGAAYLPASSKACGPDWQLRFLDFTRDPGGRRSSALGQTAAPPRHDVPNRGRWGRPAETRPRRPVHHVLLRSGQGGRLDPAPRHHTLPLPAWLASGCDHGRRCPRRRDDARAGRAPRWGSLGDPSRERASSGSMFGPIVPLRRPSSAFVR